MFRTILTPLDGSTFGEHALPLALGIARRSGAACGCFTSFSPRPRSTRKARCSSTIRTWTPTSASTSDPPAWRTLAPSRGVSKACRGRGRRDSWRKAKSAT